MIICDAALCTDCAKCIKACPTSALRFPNAIENATASLSAGNGNGSGPTGSRLTGGGWRRHRLLAGRGCENSRAQTARFSIEIRAAHRLEDTRCCGT